MAEKSGKKTKKKAAKADTGVLGNLSASRPTRLGGERRGATSRASSRPAAASAAKTATAATPAAAKTSTAAKPAAAKPRATAKPKATKPKVRTNAGTQPKPPAAPPKGWQTPGQDGGRSGSDIVTTAVQAAGELAQLGVAVGGQILRRAASRIPRP